MVLVRSESAATQTALDSTNLISCFKHKHNFDTTPTVPLLIGCFPFIQRPLPLSLFNQELSRQLNNLVIKTGGGLHWKKEYA